MIRRRLLRRFNRELSCREVGRVLQSYLDGGVDPAFAAQIADHLEDCRHCGLEAETYRSIKASLAGRQPTVDEATLQRLRDFGQRLTDD